MRRRVPSDYNGVTLYGDGFHVTVWDEANVRAMGKVPYLMRTDLTKEEARREAKALLKRLREDS
jgi:hypothetical protein